MVVARGFKTPIGEADIGAAPAQNGWCFDVHRMLCRWSYFSRAGTRPICRFNAPDAESVRQVQDRVGLPYEQAWPAVVFMTAAKP